MPRVEDFKQHVERIEQQIAKPLMLHSTRFPSAGALVAKFREVSRSLPGEPQFDIRQFNSFVNEMCVAAITLREASAAAILHYERRLTNTAKSVDFALIVPDQPTIWMDVKTIDPEWQDDAASQARLQRAQQHVAANVHLIVDAVNFHHMSAARARFLEYALEFEEKIRLLTAEERGYYRMVYCGSGFSWHRDELEDFADFYHTGVHRPDDGMRNMESFYIQANQLHLDRSIQDICLLFRPYEAEAITEAKCGVRGPALPF